VLIVLVQNKEVVKGLHIAVKDLGRRWRDRHGLAQLFVTSFSLLVKGLESRLLVRLKCFDHVLYARVRQATK